MGAYSGSGNDGGGNPVKTENYRQNLKWGEVSVKWNDAITRPDSEEKNANYEGE